MQAFYLERLGEPHIALSETHQLFSTFVSTYLSESYETCMVSAQKVYNMTKAIVDLREGKEDHLALSRESLEAFVDYISWEEEVKHPEFCLVRTLYERALQRYSNDAELWQNYIIFVVSIQLL